MVSPSRELDRALRASTLECIAVAMRMFKRTGDQRWYDDATELGNASVALKTRIETHDYTPDDADYQLVRNQQVEWNAMRTAVLV